MKGMTSRGLYDFGHFFSPNIGRFFEVEANLKLPTPWYRLELVPSEIGQLCAHQSMTHTHDSYLMTHTPSDRGGIDLCAVCPKN